MKKSPEVILAEQFSKSVGCELGFYNASTQEFVTTLNVEPQFKKNVEIIKKCLKSGWKEADLRTLIFSSYKDGRRCVLISDILPKDINKNESDPNQNLLEDSITHPLGWIIQKPIMTLDQNGELVRGTSLSVTAKDTLTLKEVVDYYLTNVESLSSKDNRKSVTGAIAYLIREYDLDTVLFAIDLAANDNTPIDPLGLKKYFVEARKEIKYRKQD